MLRMLYLAHFTMDRFGRLIIVGVMAMFFAHVIENIGMTIGVLPITGIPLPFISYGGTSLLFLMAMVGMLLNISRYPKDREN